MFTCMFNVRNVILHGCIIFNFAKVILTTKTETVNPIATKTGVEIDSCNDG
jgi:hypothetical protein